MRYFPLLLALCGCTPQLDVGPDDFCLNVLGETACNFTLTDQNGADFNLYDYAGKMPVVLDLSAQWCGPCQYAASLVQETQDRYGEENFVYVSVILEDSYGQAPDLADIKLWAEFFEISAPVLVGDVSFLNGDAQNTWSIASWPTFYFLDRNMIIQESLQGFLDSNVNREIEELL